MSKPGTLASAVSHYRILGRLGQGGMGEVYLAEDMRLQRRVALKIVRAESRGYDAARRLVTEARAAARLDHPNICSIYEVGEHEGAPYIAMQLVEGETLADRMRRPLALPEALEIAAEIAEALAEAHDHGIVHRDVKPTNVMISSRGQVKVMDFGLARVLETGAGAGREDATVSRLTAAGLVVGTVPYMSPEQARGESLDGRTDIFSLGSLLYEMIAGRHPFAAASAAETLSTILKQDPPALARCVPGLPHELERIVTKALQKDRHQRYQTARDMALDLRKAMESVAPGRDARPPTATGPSAPRGVTTRWAAGAAAILLGAAFLVVARERRVSPSVARSAIASVAVLPLANLSSDVSQDYFADGMTEALITELAKIRAIRVTSRTSVMAYKNARKPLPEIARELHVDAIVEGSVLRSENRVRVTAQLIRASSDEHLWAEGYERELRDVLTLQREVARGIAREIRATVRPDEASRLAEAPPVDPQVNDACLRGLFYLNEGINRSQAAEAQELLEKSMRSYEDAIARDAAYAPAHSGLARACHWRASRGRPDQYPRCKAAALRAIELDDGLAEAHAALAFIVHQHDWDLAQSEREYRRALELNPSLGNSGHHGYALLLSAMGRHTEAVSEIQRAEQLDPLTLPLLSNAGYIYLRARQYDRAAEQFRRVIAIDGSYAQAYSGLGQTHVLQGKSQEGLDELKRALEVSHADPQVAAALAWAHARAGNHREAAKLLPTVEVAAATSPFLLVRLAGIYSALGRPEDAFAALERGYAAHSSAVLGIGNAPELDPLRSDPRFHDLLRRVGLFAQP